MDREEVLYAQLAQQFSLGITTLRMHRGGPFRVDLVRDKVGGRHGFPVASQPRKFVAQLSSYLRIRKGGYGRGCSDLNECMDKRVQALSRTKTKRTALSGLPFDILVTSDNGVFRYLS